MQKTIVYVVDDSDLILDLVRKILENSGEIEGSYYQSGIELLNQLRPGVVDCVVADLKMPDVDGEELFQRIRQCDPLVSIVIMTGFADVKTAVRLMEQGTFTLLEKPFTQEELIAAVKRATNHTCELRKNNASLTKATAMKQLLTAEEAEVLECIVSGLTNKEIANTLTLSPRTLDRRRQSILRKLNVNTVAEAVALIARTAAISR
ncbi:response regulator transcription factor [Neorhodopirellula pilleata]|uniref:Response regulator protein TmoT n=1 Tax=Neorhodopirellula pilleata TaxID=2714738 RepID=A0A5C5ZGR6_9BACT|nr:response regulator [Neorhodopirellula pilleata]TWT86061.1 Response regulator protein TmoT [Neorhodopirellula pilleata]